MTIDAETLGRYIDAGRGVAAADLVVKNVKLLDVITGTITETDIAMVGPRIVGTYGRYEGAREIDGTGLFAVPGFIDTHLHVESSLVTPLEFDRCVLPHGVTTAICDPHEIANVLGAEGIAYFQRCAEQTIMDLRVQLSSCVPATAFETSGAELSAADLVALRGHPSGIGLAEFMNFPGVLFKDEGCLEKLEAFSDGHIDGHAPLLVGRDLNGYISAGIRTEHEATTLPEAREKLMKGMTVLIREGSVSKDLHALIPLITPDTSAFLAFCTDDRNPLDIAEEGHLDFMIRTAIAHGAPLHHVYRVASWSAANAFGLTDRGLVAPGRRADIVLLDNLEACSVRHVISAGRLVTEELFATRTAIAPVGLESMKAEPVAASDFRIPATSSATRVMGVVPGRIITEDVALDLAIVDGEKRVDLDKDAVKVCVVARHGKNRNIGRGFVHGFGMKRGAIASSVGHDSHNICVVGADDADMAVAVNRLIELKGGFVVAEGGKVTAELALPVAGLMSTGSFEEVHDALIPLRAAAKALGVVLAEPFLQVAFLPLPVIPHLKITDFGMFDVDHFALLEPQGSPGRSG
ncbi:adenine deaminase [Angulomicrobium tetraedrale]|uniref:Adenine deaminase n=1 Tax=Ancylobacter tetraedralis TaxID=217068 RepID=A0A839ZBR0_9HYPH|nr:adenine deaminase [Ancylobacter tetraedralis]MBB3772147.1 adenine deaminase [Ancylobacter tetraedralis]